MTSGMPVNPHNGVYPLAGGLRLGGSDAYPNLWPPTIDHLP
jgi:hypothetical protein